MGTVLKLQREVNHEQQGLTLVLLFLLTGTVMAQEPKVNPLMSKNLSEIPGKEVLMFTVEYPPGGQTQSTDTMRRRLFTCWRARLRCR